MNDKSTIQAYRQQADCSEAVKPLIERYGFQSTLIALCDAVAHDVPETSWHAAAVPILEGLIAIANWSE
ncbi:MAG: hypothetical protein F6K04_02360 [Leptolyngbya sp. SIO4C5]|nr:hypothetical protein [Leptolyngbya sp. SIO4C5]